MMMMMMMIGDHDDDDDVVERCKEGANINDNEPRKVWGSKYLPTVADNDTHVVKNCQVDKIDDNILMAILALY